MAALEFYDGTKWVTVGSQGVNDITAGSNIVISGSATNPIISLSDSVTIPQNLSSLSVITSDGGTFGGQKGINLPKGTTAQRPSSVVEGTVRVNTDPQPTVNVGVIYIPSNIKMAVRLILSDMYHNRSEYVHEKYTASRAILDRVNYNLFI